MGNPLSTGLSELAIIPAIESALKENNEETWKERPFRPSERKIPERRMSGMYIGLKSTKDIVRTISRQGGRKIYPCRLDEPEKRGGMPGWVRSGNICKVETTPSQQKKLGQNNDRVAYVRTQIDHSNTKKRT